MKKIIALCLAGVMTASALAGCGSNNAASSGGASGNKAAANGSKKGVEISMLNSKGEIQSGLEDIASAYEAKTGVKIDVMACGAGESPYTKLTSMYNSGSAPTMSIVDPTDVMALAKSKATDLSGEKWTSKCKDTAWKVDGKVYSFPLCIEGSGLIYNKEAIEKTLKTTFDPNSINSYDALKNLLEKLRAGGMQYPVVISKEDWSLGSHQLGMVYNTYDGTQAGSAKLINNLKAGTAKMETTKRFDQFTHTLDLLLAYNVNHADPLGAIYEQDPTYLVDEKAAIWFNGDWAWPNLKDAGAKTSDKYGFLPYVLSNDTSDFANTKMQASSSKQIMIDKQQASADQVQAAKDFLNWLVYDKEAQKMLTEKCALIPACKNNPNSATDPLSRDIQAKQKAGKTYNCAYIAPGDHWKVLGADMQKYIAHKETKAQLAAAIDKYWTSQK